MTMTFEEWKAAVGKAHKKLTHLRKGQIYYGCLPMWIYNKLHMTEFDCYYVDDKFDQFIMKVEELWGRHDDIAGTPGHEVISVNNLLHTI